MKQGKVIFLNGTSSAGKSSIVDELQKMTDVPYEVTGFDAEGHINDFYIYRDVMISFFEKKLERKLTPKEVNWFRKESLGAVLTALSLPEEQKDKDSLGFLFYLSEDDREILYPLVTIEVNKVMCKKIVDFVKQGKNVIVDTAILSGDNPNFALCLKKLFEELKNLENILFVCVYCPYSVLIKYIKQRREKGDYRPIEIALWQFAKMYKAKDEQDEVDLGVLFREEVIAGCEEARSEFAKKEEFNKFKNKVLKGLSLVDEDSKSIRVTSRLSYDCIIDTSRLNPQESAQQILDNLRTSEMKAFNKNYEKFK